MTVSAPANAKEQPFSSSTTMSYAPDGTPAGTVAEMRAPSGETSSTSTVATVAPAASRSVTPPAAANPLPKSETGKSTSP